MADVRPFRGVRFDPDRTGALGGVLCPPFDEINAERRDDLLGRSAHNVVRLESPRAEHDGADIYAQSAAQLKAWLSEGVLAQDGQPAYYIMQEAYASEAGPRQRVGVFAAIHLEEYERAIVLPHEYTRRGPKEDRLAMMEACGANFSPIMAMYRDPGGVGTLLWECIANREPDCTADAPNGVSYRLWLLNDPGTVDRLRDLFKPIPIYIADGHHRYETALAYRDNVRGRERVRLDSQASEFVLMCLDRVRRPRHAAALLPPRALRPFDGQALRAAGTGLRPLHRRVAAPGRDEPRAHGRVPRQALGGPATASRPWASSSPRRAASRCCRCGATSAPARCPTRPRRRCSSARRGCCTARCWTRSSAEAAVTKRRSTSSRSWTCSSAGSREGDCQAAFLVPPLDLAVFESLVREGQRLPPKTTYFLPKLPTGPRHEPPHRRRVAGQGHSTPPKHRTRGPDPRADSSGDSFQKSILSEAIRLRKTNLSRSGSLSVNES